MAEAQWARLDAAMEELHRRLRVRLRRELRRGGEWIGGGFHILEYLVLKGPSSPSELADQLEVRTSTMTAHLDRLEEAGYVERLPAAGGPGRRTVHLTPEGEEAYRHFRAVRQAVLRQVLAGLTAEEQAQLAELLERAVAAAPGAASARGGVP